MNASMKNFYCRVFQSFNIAICLEYTWPTMGTLKTEKIFYLKYYTALSQSYRNCICYFGQWAWHCSAEVYKDTTHAWHWIKCDTTHVWHWIKCKLVLSPITLTFYLQSSNPLTVTKYIKFTKHQCFQFIFTLKCL